MILMYIPYKHHTAPTNLHGKMQESIQVYNPRLQQTDSCSTSRGSTERTANTKNLFCEWLTPPSQYSITLLRQVFIFQVFLFNTSEKTHYKGRQQLSPIHTANEVFSTQQKVRKKVVVTNRSRNQQQRKVENAARREPLFGTGTLSSVSAISKEQEVTAPPPHLRTLRKASVAKNYTVLSFSTYLMLSS